MGGRCSCALHDHPPPAANDVRQLDAVLVEAMHRNPDPHPVAVLSRRSMRLNPMQLPTATPRNTLDTLGGNVVPEQPQADHSVGLPILSVDDGTLLVSFRSHAVLLGSNDSSDSDNGPETLSRSANSANSSFVHIRGVSEGRAVAIIPLQSPKSGEYKEQLARRRRRSNGK